MKWIKTIYRFLVIAIFISCVTPAFASTNVLMMPDRDALSGTKIVLWGNTKFPNSTSNYTIDFGDGTAPVSGSVIDQSYIFATHTYTSSGTVPVTFPATLTVTPSAGSAEFATAQITVWDSTAIPADSLRGIKVDMAIQDGLRYLYYSQYNRASTFTTNMTSWRSSSNENHTNSFSNLAILAIQNQGHLITNDPTKDIFQPVVQRGLNRLFDILVKEDLRTPASTGTCAARVVGNPCVGVPADGNEIWGLGAIQDFYDGYATPIFAAALAAAVGAAPNRTVDPSLGSGNGGFVANRTYAEILQRIVNAIVRGQGDQNNYYGYGEGGWYYYLNEGIYQNNCPGCSDGSTMGWALLGLIDSGAAGAQVPPFVKTEFAKTFASQYNNDGSLDYQVDNNPASDSNTNDAKTGIALQGLAFLGTAVNDPKVVASMNYVTRNWNSMTDGQSYPCENSAFNKNCAYSMFNIFKGLKLYGISTLPGIGRPAGPGSIAADDWYADYVDNLLSSQHSPTDPTRGEWSQSDTPTMGWSCCESDTTGITALSELVLSPVAFVRPSVVRINISSTKAVVGSRASVTSVSTTGTADNPGAPVPGATITFKVLSGPNAGIIQNVTTDTSGQATFVYTSSAFGIDHVQASVETVQSQVVNVVWKRLPVFTGTRTQGVRPGRDLNFVVTAADPCTDATCGGSDPITIAAGLLPTNATFSSVTNTFSWLATADRSSAPTSVQFLAGYTSITTPSPTTQAVVIGKYPGFGSTDPNNKDTDGDGYSDYVEVAAGTDPGDPTSHPASGPTGLYRTSTFIDSRSSTESKIKPKQ